MLGFEPPLAGLVAQLREPPEEQRVRTHREGSLPAQLDPIRCGHAVYLTTQENINVSDVVQPNARARACVCV